jgi:hypothetical protein
MKNVFLFVFLFGFFALSCDNHAHDHDDDHMEPVGFFLRESGATLVTYQNATVTGSVTVAAGAETGLISVVFVNEENEEFTPEGDEYALNLSTTSSAFEFEQHAEDGKWRFHIKGITAGSGEFVLRLMHGDHADFISKAIPVTVSASAN